jgi:hypothetical protein
MGYEKKKLESKAERVEIEYREEEEDIKHKKEALEEGLNSS